MGDVCVSHMVEKVVISISFELRTPSTYVTHTDFLFVMEPSLFIGGGVPNKQDIQFPMKHDFLYLLVLFDTKGTIICC